MASNLAFALLLATGATESRSFGDRFADRLSVTDFKNDDDSPVVGDYVPGVGGITGTGTDNATGLQHAIDAALPSGENSSRPLFIPAGNYRTSKTLYIRGLRGGRVEGAGKNATTITYTGSGTVGNPLVDVDHPDAGGAHVFTPVILLDRVEQTRFQDFSICGTTTNRTQSGSTTQGFFCYQGPYESPYTTPPGSNICSQCTFFNVGVSNLYDHGYNFGVGANCENMILIGCDIDQCDFAGVFAGNPNSLNHIVMGGKISNCGSRGTYVGGYGAVDVTGGLMGQTGTFLYIAGVTFENNKIDAFLASSNCNIIGGRTTGGALSECSIVTGGGSFMVSGFIFAGATDKMFVDSNGGPICVSSCTYDPPTNTGSGMFANAQGSIIFDNLVMTSTARSAGVINVGIITGTFSQTTFRNCDFDGSPLPPDIVVIGAHNQAFSNVTCRAVTVAELPTPSAVWQGIKLVVSNHNGSVTFGGTPSHTSGTNLTVPVFCDGSAWKIGG